MMSDWVSEDKWKKEDLEPVWVYLSWITDLGLTYIQDKAYWSELNQQWFGYGFRDPISQGAQVKYVMPLPEPPKVK